MHFVADMILVDTSKSFGPLFTEMGRKHLPLMLKKKKMGLTVDFSVMTDPVHEPIPYVFSYSTH